MSARVLILFALAARLTVSAAPELTEAEMRTMTEALVNLPRYVEWSPGVFVVPRTPLIVGVYGNTRMHRQIVAAIDGKVLNGRRVMVRRFCCSQVPNCHVLYIAPTERRRLPWIIKKLQYSTVLTVAEFDDFLAQGGMVRMALRDEKVGFQVQMTAAEAAEVKFSSKFLAVADQVVSAP